MKKLCGILAVGLALLLVVTPIVAAQAGDVSLKVKPKYTDVGETKTITTSWDHDYNNAYGIVYISIKKSIGWGEWQHIFWDQDMVDYSVMPIEPVPGDFHASIYVWNQTKILMDLENGLVWLPADPGEYMVSVDVYEYTEGGVETYVGNNYKLTYII